MLGIRPVCLWPGLPGAWYRGDPYQLGLALAAAWLHILLVLAMFVWPAWLSPIALRFLTVFAFAGWAAVSVWEHWRFSRWLVPSTLPAGEAFAVAQGEYLRGNWFAAEAELLSILHENAEDPEALLLLVSVLRRTGRWQPALRRLQQLELLDAAYRWRHEIASERRLLQRGAEAVRDALPADSPEVGPEVDTDTEVGSDAADAASAASGTLPIDDRIECIENAG